jgi:hypothetical protein
MMLRIGALLLVVVASQSANAQTFSDPESYCKSVTTIDEPDARYAGPQTTEAMAQAFNRRLSQGGSYEWRCLEGVVYVCVTLNSPRCGKMATAASADILDYCSNNAGADFIPASIAGRDIQWACNGSKPFAKNVPKVDKRGFEVADWKALRPGWSRTANPPVEERLSNKVRESYPVPPPRKRDIDGVALGMSAPDYNAIMKKNGCTAQHSNVIGDYMQCPIGKFRVYFAAGLTPPRIQTITFEYCTGQTQEDAWADLQRRFQFNEIKSWTPSQLDANSTIMMVHYPNSCNQNGQILNGIALTLHDFQVGRDAQLAIERTKRTVAPPKF